jgi:hypothetical protein
MSVRDEQPLFDMVESNQLVIFTGAGFSFDFQGSDGQRLPGWKDLLLKIRTELEGRGAVFRTLSGEPAEELLDTFFAEAFPRGEHLIEAATILRRADPRMFRTLVDRYLTPASIQPAGVTDSYTRKHRAILNLEPRGIVTVNVDRFHERFLKHERNHGWKIHDPVNEADSGGALILKHISEQRFLIKAHGTIGRKIVFDYDAYRDLLEKTPSYPALINYLFSHYRMLFIGFGLSDLDFDFLIDTAVRRFGSPLQQHLTLQIKRPRGRSKEARIRDSLSAARAARLRERFGIRTLEVSAGDLIPLLERAASTPGIRLHQLIRSCTSSDLDERRNAHRELKLLGVAGKRVAMKVLYERVHQRLLAATGRLRADELHVLSELTYSLGELDPFDSADRRVLASHLLDIVESTLEVEIVAHALWALVTLVQSTDLQRLRRIKRSSRLDHLTIHRRFPAPPQRCGDYLDALISRVAAERSSRATSR